MTGQERLNELMVQYKNILKEDYMLPRYQINGNEIFQEQFLNNEFLLLEYCINHKMTWQEVLDYEFNPDAIY